MKHCAGRVTSVAGAGSWIGRTVAVLSAVVTVAWPSSAAALPGPPLQEPVAGLEAALACTPDVASSKKTTVLLVHGTGATPEEDWAWNFAQILPREGYPTCTVRIPNRALTDLQINVEYVVYAIRALAQRSGRKIAVIGHSQGAFLPTFALRFWPDLAGKVDDLIGFAGAYALGTTQANSLCATVCTDALQQFRPGSKLLSAYATRLLPRGPAYTGFLTLSDEVVTPQPQASTLNGPGVRNYTQQDLCLADLAEHLLIVGEAPFVTLTLDALTHPGPASLERVAPLACGLIPEAAGAAPAAATFLAGIATAGATHPSTREPPLRCYLDPNCPKARLTPGLRATTTPKRDRKAPFRYTTRGTLELPEGAINPCAGTVTITIKRGRRTLSRRTTTVADDCTFSAKAKVPRNRTRSSHPPARMRVLVSYAGTQELLPIRTRSRRLLAG